MLRQKYFQLILWGQQNLDVKIKKDCTRKESYLISLIKVNVTHNIIYKMITYQDQVGFILGIEGWFNIRNINVIFHIKRKIWSS